ncbi:MAG TPA: hypothetical protein PKA89_13665, partial [Phycicoccus sp.]|nr:hypothetical protein [Phycicoccus sp.]
RQRTAEDAGRMPREAPEYPRAAGPEIARAPGEARRRADAGRAEAHAAVERARSEVHTLAARRDAITTQLSRLSGVIEALDVHDATLDGEADSRAEPSPEPPAPQSAPAPTQDEESA